jgi:prepilin-type N-terminal cleavage/methylation domain-containing protein
MNNKATSYELRVTSYEFQGLNPKLETRNPKPQPRFAAQAARGFSLIELMVSLVIGLFILAGVVYVMANSRKNYETTDYTARLQENARFALHYLGFDLRNAGFSGCSDNQAWVAASAILGEDLGGGYSSYGDSVRSSTQTPIARWQVQSTATAMSPYPFRLTLGFLCPIAQRPRYWKTLPEVHRTKRP